MKDNRRAKDLVSEETKKGLTEFEVEIIRLLRSKNLGGMVYSGQIIIHYDRNAKPVSIEKREFRA
jgi:ligand-binding sensor protein